jgi:hypothetical protein
VRTHARGTEARPRGEQRLVFLADREEALVVRTRLRGIRAFALADDRVDRGARGDQAPDDLEAGQPADFRTELVRGIAGD